MVLWDSPPKEQINTNKKRDLGHGLFPMQSKQTSKQGKQASFVDAPQLLALSSWNWLQRDIGKNPYSFCVAQCNKSKLGNRMSGASLFIFGFSLNFLRFLHNSLNSTNKGMNGRVDWIDGWMLTLIYLLSFRHCTRSSLLLKDRRHSSLHSWEYHENAETCGENTKNYVLIIPEIAIWTGIQPNLAELMTELMEIGERGTIGKQHGHWDVQIKYSTNWCTSATSLRGGR